MLPDGWQCQALGDVCEVVTGGTPNRSIVEYWNGDIPWMSSGEINQRVVKSVAERITPLGMTNSNASPLPPGTVMMALNGQGKTRGKVAILEIETTCNQSLAGMIADRERVAPEYLFYALDAQYQAIRNITGDDARNGLNLRILRGLRLDLPPLDEQRRIAEVLRSVDEAIAAADVVARQWETALTTLLDSAFRGGDLSSLDDLCSLIYRYPGFYGFDQLEEGVPVIRGEHLRAGRISTDWTDFYFVDPEFSARFPKTVLQLNDVVMSVRGTVGTTAVVEASHVGSQISPNLIRLAADPAKIMPPLLYFAVQSAVAHMRRTIVNAQALPAINAGDLKRVEIALPPLAEQPALLAELNGAAAATTQAVAAMKQARQTKGMLMSDLLSGRVRVPA